MRALETGRLRVRAISGTHVVFLAFDMAPEDAQGLMGFAIQRSDLTEDETIWLRGNKTFASVRPATGHEDASSREHPFQAFQWADYSTKPGYRYRYRVQPLYGRPGALIEGAATTVSIATEALSAGRHDVHFNRGAIASQAFVKRFPGQTLDEAGGPAYAWLGRDLVPALLDFIAQAQDASVSLHLALYELHQPGQQPWPDVLAALQQAVAAGARVQLIYHGEDDSTGQANRQAVAAAGLDGVALPRRRARLMHNKFIVLSRHGQPEAVWTGSTNLSRNALYGQLNVGHVVRDAAVAQRFLAYWQALSRDPGGAELKDWTAQHNPLPPAQESDEVVCIFSPHRGAGVLQWWIDLASRATPLFMTFPFGIVKDFRPPFDRADGVLRFALLDKYVNGGTAATRAEAVADIERIRRHPNVGMAVGSSVTVDWVDGWRREAEPIGVNVNWVHTKFMLLDPLGPAPITLTGSANFSLASVSDNDENMLLVRGDTRVADIYFSEFMRVFAHHRFRESLLRHQRARSGSLSRDARTASGWKPQNLFEHSADWVPAHYLTGSEKDIKRRYFAGT